jgi:hypothetical protein
VYHLATIAPHEPTAARYDAAAWRSYCEGYYCALAFALRAMELERRRRARLAKIRRARARRATVVQFRSSRVFLVRRVIGAEQYTFTVYTRAAALWWARYMRERWGEPVLLERIGFPAVTEVALDRAERAERMRLVLERQARAAAS